MHHPFITERACVQFRLPSVVDSIPATVACAIPREQLQQRMAVGSANYRDCSRRSSQLQAISATAVNTRLSVRLGWSLSEVAISSWKQDKPLRASPSPAFEFLKTCNSSRVLAGHQLPHPARAFQGLVIHSLPRRTSQVQGDRTSYSLHRFVICAYE